MPMNWKGYMIWSWHQGFGVYVPGGGFSHCRKWCLGEGRGSYGLKDLSFAAPQQEHLRRGRGPALRLKPQFSRSLHRIPHMISTESSNRQDVSAMPLLSPCSSSRQRWPHSDDRIA